MFCKNCGAQIPDNAKFCPSCGKETGAAARQANQTAGQSASRQTYRSSSSGPARTYRTSSSGPTRAYRASSSGSAGTGRFLEIIGPQPSFTYGSYFVWGGCLLSFISLYLSFYHETVVNEYSLRFIDMDHSGWIIVLLIAVAILNIFKIYVGDIIGGGIAAIIIWNYVANAREVLGNVDSFGEILGIEGSITDAVVSYGAGLYLMIIGLLALLGGAVFGLVRAVQDHR